MLAYHQDSTFESFQEAGCTVQKQYTMKTPLKMYHGATEVRALTRPERLVAERVSGTV